MFALVIEGPGEPRRRVAFAKTPITIGRRKDNHLVLPRDDVSRQHARLVQKQGWYVLEDLESTAGTFVNGIDIGGQRRLQPGDRIGIGGYILVFEATDEITVERVVVPVDAIEAQLLAGIAAREDDSRLVYADWLEGRGQLDRAEFLRVQQAMIGIAVDDARFRGLSERLRELAATIDVQWRRKVARPAIESCATFDFQCPKEWGALAPTQRSNVKHCDACKKDVFYCIDVSEARQHAARGRCVALDLASVRWPGDLEPPFGESACRHCGIDLGPEPLEMCPQCGGALADEGEMMMGLMA